MRAWIGKVETHRGKWRLRIGEGRQVLERLHFDTEAEAEEARRVWLEARPEVKRRLRARSDRAEPASHVYFIRSRSGIKIGITDNIVRRMATLQSANSHRLTLLLMLPGGANEERALHRMFAEERLQGEWFSPSRRLLAFISECHGTAAREIERGQLAAPLAPAA